MNLDERGIGFELDPHPINLLVDSIKIFEVIGHEIPLAQLPAGAKHTEWSTVV